MSAAPDSLDALLKKKKTVKERPIIYIYNMRQAIGRATHIAQAFNRPGFVIWAQPEFKKIIDFNKVREELVKLGIPKDEIKVELIGSSSSMMRLHLTTEAIKRLDELCQSSSNKIRGIFGIEVEASAEPVAPASVAPAPSSAAAVGSQDALAKPAGSAPAEAAAGDSKSGKDASEVASSQQEIAATPSDIDIPMKSFSLKSAEGEFLFFEKPVSTRTMLFLMQGVRENRSSNGETFAQRKMKKWFDK